MDHHAHQIQVGGLDMLSSSIPVPKQRLLKSQPERKKKLHVSRRYQLQVLDYLMIRQRKPSGINAILSSLDFVY